jgi:hypothetical protein
MKLWLVMPALALAGCVEGPRTILPVDFSGAAWSRVLVDRGDAITDSEAVELTQVLQSGGHGGPGSVRAIPSFSFRPAAIAVVADDSGAANPANHAALAKKGLFHPKRWQARYSLTLIDDGGKQLRSYAVEQSVGKNGRDAARRTCFTKLIADLTLASNH